MRRILLASLCIALCMPAPARAQAPAAGGGFPSKALRMFVGYPPGGGVDVAARLVSAALSDYWGVPIVVENRPGGTGSVATETVVRSPRDGYTAMLCQIASHAITPARNKLAYDHIRDFAFISMVGTLPNVFVVHPSLPAKNLREFIALAKARPGKINFASSGVGASPHLSIELFRIETGINIVHVPYKGAGQAVPEVMGGQIESYVGNLVGASLAAIKSGRVRALGVTSAKRNKQVPDVPTFDEAGVPGFDVSSWYGICTPGPLPKAVHAKFNGDLVQLLEKPVLKSKLEEQGIDVTPSTPEQFAEHVRKETARWTKVVRTLSLGPEL
ncbi:MAG TPA: tripartite tricarboxylate transporter substrate binding protein [Burkholderiales bacterium]|nr:tripartite tricarboxylate transporter substrate binding protein [Burkholderiales bacterium]